jgi:phosphoglycolate phosphatase-like HAD superfamily hydrolase
MASLAPASSRRVRAALFDMDGTLLDIEPLSTQAINQQCAPQRQLGPCKRTAG